MGITYSSNKNQEGKIYNVNDDTSLVESPFISTETYNEIKNTGDEPKNENDMDKIKIILTPKTLTRNSLTTFINKMDNKDKIFVLDNNCGFNNYNLGKTCLGLTFGYFEWFFKQDILKSNIPEHYEYNMIELYKRENIYRYLNNIFK